MRIAKIFVCCIDVFVCLLLHVHVCCLLMPFFCLLLHVHVCLYLYHCLFVCLLLRVHVCLYLYHCLFVVYNIHVCLHTYLALVFRLLLWSNDNEGVGIEEAVDWSMF